MMKEWNEMTKEERTEMVSEIWAIEDDRIPLIGQNRGISLPASPRKEAKLRSAITKLKMESV
jgi:hypothetical protein